MEKITQTAAGFEWALGMDLIPCTYVAYPQERRTVEAYVAIEDVLSSYHWEVSRGYDLEADAVLAGWQAVRAEDETYVVPSDRIFMELIPMYGTYAVRDPWGTYQRGHSPDVYAEDDSPLTQWVWGGAHADDDREEA